MSRLSDLIAKIENPELRAQIEEAANQALKQKKFGLVFEEHLRSVRLCMAFLSARVSGYR